MKLSPVTRRLIRNTEREQRLGEKPCCVLCGESNPLRLLKTGHHITFRSRDGKLVVTSCGSCHLEAHARLADATIGPEREGSIKASTASRLRAMAVFHRQEADALDRWATELEGAC